MIIRTRWTLDSSLFAAVVVIALSISNQTALTGSTLKNVILDVLGGILFLALPLLLAAAIRFNWLYRSRQADTGYVRKQTYFGKTAVMAAITVAAFHMFTPSWTLVVAIVVAVALTGVLTIADPFKVAGG